MNSETLKTEPVESSKLAAVRTVSLRDLVYDNLLQAIMAKKLRPDDHLREVEMAQMLNVSRTPMREALTLLERDGFVRYHHNRGWFVAKYAPDEIREIFTLRSGLENMAGDLIINHLREEDFAALDALIEEQASEEVITNAARRWDVDTRFHKQIVRMAKNARLYQMWERIYAQCTIVFNYHTVTMPDYNHMQGVIDHTAIVDALRSGSSARMHAVNNEINERVAAQCIAGYLAVEAGAKSR